MVGKFEKFEKKYGLNAVYSRKMEEAKKKKKKKSTLF